MYMAGMRKFKIGMHERGFLFWDVWGKVDAGRALIDAGAPLGQELASLLA